MYVVMYVCPGQVQNKKCIEDVLQFAYEENLFVMADEVNSTDSVAFPISLNLNIELYAPVKLVLHFEFFIAQSCLYPYIRVTVSGGTAEIVANLQSLQFVSVFT